MTRSDVARYAGVSSAVVSYVVNDGPRRVAPETAARVRAAIEVLGYRPNRSARALRRGSTEMLGLVLSDISNPFFAELAIEIGAEAAAQGYAVLIANSRADADLEVRLVEDLIRRQVDGMILASVDAVSRGVPLADRSGTPVVLIDCQRPVAGHSSIGPRAADGARAAVDHLLQVHGHASVALLIGRETSGVSDEREHGWNRALRDAGRPAGPLARADFTREGGYVAAQKLLAARPRPTAVFVSSDLQAVGSLQAFRHAGLSVPEDVAVVSFDGTREAEFCNPPLTASRQPVRQMAVRAVAAVLAPGDPPRTELYPMDLVLRESCGCGYDPRHGRRAPTRPAAPQPEGAS